MATKSAAKAATGKTAGAKAAIANAAAKGATAPTAATPLPAAPANGVAASGAVAEVGATPPGTAAAGAPTVVPQVPLRIVESKRDIREIISERVKMNDSGTALDISEDLPLEEWLPLFDYFVASEKHIGFIIGDLVNFAQKKYGEKYAMAMEKTGRAYSTVQVYATVAASIPPNMRREALGFSHHRVVARLEDKKVVKELLKLAEKGEDGKAASPIPVRDFQKLVDTKYPAPKRVKKTNAAKPGRKKKTKKAATKEPVAPYEPNDDEKVALDMMYEQADALRATLDEAIVYTDTNGKEVKKSMKDLLLQLDNNSKITFCKAFAPFAELHKIVDDKTGYPGR